jgi:HSP20 family protein
MTMNRLLNTEANRNPVSRWGLWDNELDRAFENFLRPVRWIEEAAGNLAFPLDVAERNDEFVITAELPGVKKQDIDVTLENGVLTIAAETKVEQADKDGERIVRQERRYGKYVRSLRLGTQIDERKINAQYKDGVLQLTLPKAEEVKPKKITVDVA